MPFLTPLDVRATGRRRWTLLADLVYKASGIVLTIPSGFVSDLASIPALFRGVLPVNDRHREAAVVHDYLYESQIVTRAEADAIFLVAMEESGVSLWKRTMMYSGVRAGGWLAWRKHAKRREKNLAPHRRAS